MDRRRSCVNCIAPPHILERLLLRKDSNFREAALNSLLGTTQLRGERMVRALTWAAGAPDTGRRSI